MFLINFNLWHWSCACVGIDIEWFYYVYYCTRATCFDSYRIIFRPF